MTTPRFQTLQASPRQMAVSARMLCWFSTFSGIWTCWYWIAAGFAVSTLLFASLDRRDFMVTEWKASGQARIVKKDVAKLNNKKNSIYKYTFEWQTLDGKTNQEECFSKSVYHVGNSVDVVCSAKNESIAKIDGSSFGNENRVWLVFIPHLIGFLSGICPLFVSIRAGKKSIHLLQFGTPTIAQVQEYVQDGQTPFKHFPIVKFSVVFQESDMTVHSTELLEARKNMNNIEPELPVFYDPDNPKFVKSFEMIPKGVTYDSSLNEFQGSFFALFPHYLGITALAITFVWIFAYFASLFL